MVAAMSEKDEKQPEPKKKRPYEKPAIVTEEVFESQALKCQGKDHSCETPPVSRQGS
jgi:hypothetical protein